MSEIRASKITSVRFYLILYYCNIFATFMEYLCYNMYLNIFKIKSKKKIYIMDIQI